MKKKADPGTLKKVLKRVSGHWLLLAVSILCAAVNKHAYLNNEEELPLSNE